MNDMETAHITRHSSDADLVAAVSAALHGTRGGRDFARSLGLSHGLVAGIATGARPVTDHTREALGRYARATIAAETVRHRERMRLLAILSDRYPEE